jgi:hypothetical protein
MTVMVASTSRRWLLLTLALAGTLLVGFLDRGWYPHDEGSLGQSAERVLDGEVPHRDFDELYTGALTYLNAAAFAIGGERLTVLRVPLLLTALVWTWALFALARRILPPAGAALLVLLAIAWSVPNYPAAMPSWYNLFLATFGTLALARWIDDRRARWLVVAGFLGGLSFLFKLSGLFFLVGGSLFLLEASRSDREPTPGSIRPGAWPMPAVITAALGVFVFLLWRSIAPLQVPRVMLHFVVPGGLVAAGLAWREWTAPPAPFLVRLRELLRAALPFVAGAVLAVLPALVALQAAGALEAWYNGVFVTPFLRLASANMLPPAVRWMATLLPVLFVLRPRADHADPVWRKRGLFLALALTVVLVSASMHFNPHRATWQSLRSLVPLIGLLVGIAAAFPDRLGWPRNQRLLVLLLGIVAVAVALVQFPFSAPIYFMYVAPLVFLAAAALVRVHGRTPVIVQGVTAGFYLCFALLLVIPGAPIVLGFADVGWARTERMTLPRAGLRVLPEHAAQYELLIPRLQEVARDRPIWAGPDAPEVYFLGGFRNHTRVLFDFLAAGTEGDVSLLEMMDRTGVAAVAVNAFPSFSAPPSPRLLAELEHRYPGVDTVGRFLVRWR